MEKANGNDGVAGTNEQLFQFSLAAEREASDFYRFLEGVFPSHPEVAAFWARMRRDEEKHVEELSRIHAGIPANLLAAAADAGILAQASRIARFGLLERAAGLENLDQAYELAHRLENSEIATVFSFIREKFIPHCAQKNFTLSMLDEHLDWIMSLPRRLGDREVRRAIALEKPRE